MLVADVWHCPLESQQPFGHEFASHTHLVALQRWPLAHTAQTPPPVPHAPALCPLAQVVALLQHPLEHELVVHTHCPLPLHVSPLPHAWQLAPPTPHVPLLDVWH